MGHLERRSVTSPGGIHDCPCETNDARMRTFRIAHFHDGRKHRAPASEYMKMPSLVGVTIEKAGYGLFRAARKSFETSDVVEGRRGWSSSSRILDQGGRQKIEGDVRIGRVTGVSANCGSLPLASEFTAVAEEARWCRRRLAHGSAVPPRASGPRFGTWRPARPAPVWGAAPARLTKRQSPSAARWSHAPGVSTFFGRRDSKMTRWRPCSVVFKVRRVLGGFGGCSVSCFLSMT